MGNNLITLGRAIGLENINQLQLLRKSVTSEQPNRYTGRFTFNTSSVMDAFVSIDKTPKKDISEIIEILRKLFPKSTSPKGETIIDIIMQKFNKGKISEGSSALTLNAVSKNGHNIMGTTELRMINNLAGSMIEINSNRGAHSALNLSMYIDRQANNSKIFHNIIREMSYTEKGKNGKLSAKVADGGIIKALTATLEAPAIKFNSLASIISYGQQKKFAEVLNTFKSFFMKKG